MSESCPKCKAELVKEKFAENYKGVEKDLLHCAKCGYWGNGSDKKEKLKE